MGAQSFSVLKEINPNFKNTGRTWFKKGRATWNKGRKMTPQEKSSWIEKNNSYIAALHKSNPKPWYSKEWLEDQYLNQLKSFAQIGREVGGDPTTIEYWAVKLNIPKRTQSEASLLEYTSGRRVAKVGHEATNWKGGLSDIGKYNLKWIGPNKQRLEHIAIAEKALGRPLRKGECVHHVNLNGKDNRPSNLVICDNAYHKWLHWNMEFKYAEEHFGGC
jgi:hypothetical protein